MNIISIKEANCRNCYKCVRACPVKAIRFQENQAIINAELCIACGQCFISCPQNARDILSDLEKVSKALIEKRKLIALIAPSFVGFYKNKGGFIQGLKMLGFSEVIEVSSGAEEVSKAYISYIEREHPTYAITSCCPTVNLLIRRYYSNLTKYLIPVVSPMIATGKAVKMADNSQFTVFIGPCLSKKCEANSVNNEGIIDAVITFEEIDSLFHEGKIPIDSLPGLFPLAWGRINGNSYPLKGQIGTGFEERLSIEGYDFFHVEGINQVKEVLRELEDRNIEKSFIELNACFESCISGPCIPKNCNSTFLRKQLVKKHVAEGWSSKGKILPYDKIDMRFSHLSSPILKQYHSDEEINKTLARMGKTDENDELDCSACGYDNCRAKAAAVIEGMSDVEMCMPFMRTRAEHMSDMIFYNSPNMIFVLDEDLSILQMNPSAEIAFSHKADELKFLPISYLMDDCDFKEVNETKENLLNRRVFYERHDLVVIRSILHLPKDNQILVIMSDITDSEQRRKDFQEMKENTIEITNKVIEKQMRVAHEIASLLGETTAETKIALNRLKDIVKEER